MTKRFTPLRVAPLCAAPFCAALALIPHAAAHHVSVVGGPQTAGPILTLSPLTLPERKWAVSIQTQILNFDSFSDDFLEDVALAGFEEVHNTDSIVAPSVTIAYGVTDRFELDLQLPYLDRNDIREGELEDGGAEVDVLGNSGGIGDLTALGRYRLLDGGGDGLSAALVVALQMPTGRTTERDDSGDLFETEFQPGTGAWSPSIGYSLAKPLGDFNFTTGGIYTFAGQGSQQTDLGDRFGFGAAVAYRLSPGEHAHAEGTAEEHAHSGWDLMVELAGEWQERERIGDEVDPHSGGTQLFVAPGVRYVSTAGWGAFVSLALPVHEDLNGIQNDTDFRLTAGLGLVF